MRCGLTTPPSMQVLPIKRPNRCGIGARYCDALCAAKMTQFLYILSCSFRLGVVAVGRNCARASCTTWCGDTRGLCAQQWFGLGDECTRLSFERRGGVLWTDPPASVCTSVANCCYLCAGCCRTVRVGWCKTSGDERYLHPPVTNTMRAGFSGIIWITLTFGIAGRSRVPSSPRPFH